MGYCPNRVIGLDLGNKSNNKSKESSAISFASLTHCGKILKAPRQNSKPRHSKSVPTMDQPTVGDIPPWQKSFNLAVRLLRFYRVENIAFKPLNAGLLLCESR